MYDTYKMVIKANTVCRISNGKDYVLYNHNLKIINPCIRGVFLRKFLSERDGTFSFHFASEGKIGW